MSIDWTPPESVLVEVYKWGHDSYGNPTARYSIFWNNGRTGDDWKGGYWHSKRREQVGYSDKISEGALARLPVLFPGTCWNLDESSVKGDRAEGRATFRAVRDYDREPVKFHLQRIRLNSGGYTSGGAYYGVDAPLFYFCSEDGGREDYIRASNRDAAKAEIRRRYPTARFFR